MVGIQFENVGADAMADFNQILKLTGVDACAFDDRVELGAEIMVREGEVYKSYFYINDAWDADDNEVEGNVWADGEGYVVTDADLQSLGDGFWFRTPAKIDADSSITVAGQVSSVSEMAKEFLGTAAGYYSIIANPFPVATNLGNVKTSGIEACAFDNRVEQGSEIMVRQGEVYKSYFFINDAWDADDNEVEGDVWADGEGYVVTEADAIPAGSSFWIVARKNGSLTFTLK